MQLSTKLSQQQLLSPQMQQGLHLLQAPMMELRQLVSQELIANPMLEEEFSNAPETSASSEKELSLYENPNDAEERRRYFLESQYSVETLAEALLTQSAGFPKKDQPLVECIIGNLDAAGYLGTSSAEMAASLGVSEQRVEETITKIQQLDPPGIAARDLKECLLLQLERKGKGNGLSSRMVKHYLPELGRHHYEEIATALRVSLEDVLQAHKIIAALEPHPGRAYGPVENQGVMSDVIVLADGNDLIVRPNEEALPRLRLNDHYKEFLSTEVENKELQNYLREKIRNGKQFLTHVEQRQKTLLAVAREIVKRQHAFFRIGELTPLTMAEVAETLDLHHTTIGRAIAGKYMETPRGLFPWKYFFTTGLQKEDGTSVSNDTVKQVLQQLIAQENKHHPLSDQEIVDQLEAQGILVARRTIANYREQLKILPKNLRKQR
ncbi:MAG: RNA polymerase factor sigma-54 [Verrucomicrobiota bacterium]